MEQKKTMFSVNCSSGCCIKYNCLILILPKTSSVGVVSITGFVSYVQAQLNNL